MALPRTSRGSATATGASDAVTSAFTPSNNSLLVVSVGGLTNGGGDVNSTTTVSGGGLTWQRIDRISQATAFAGWFAWAEIWTAEVASGASMTVTSNPSTDQDGHYVAVLEYTGYDTSDPIGAFIAGGRQDATGSWTLTLNATPAAASEIAACVSVDNWIDPPIDVVTVGTGWTEVFDFPGIGAETIGQVQIRAPGSTSTAVLWDLVDSQPNPGSGPGDNGASAAVAVEIKAAAAGLSIPVAYHHYQTMKKAR